MFWAASPSVASSISRRCTGLPPAPPLPTDAGLPELQRRVQELHLVILFILLEGIEWGCRGDRRWRRTDQGRPQKLAPLGGPSTSRRSRETGEGGGGAWDTGEGGGGAWEAAAAACRCRIPPAAAAAMIVLRERREMM
jgi:hypothetical protein